MISAIAYSPDISQIMVYPSSYKTWDNVIFNDYMRGGRTEGTLNDLKTSLMAKYGNFIINNDFFNALVALKNETITVFYSKVKNELIPTLVSHINANIQYEVMKERIEFERLITEQIKAEQLIKLEMTMENMEYQVMQVKNQLRTVEEERDDIATLANELKTLKPELQTRITSLKSTLNSMGPVESRNGELQVELNKLNQDKAVRVNELNVVNVNKSGIAIQLQSIETQIVEANDEAERINGEIAATKAQLSSRDQAKLEIIVEANDVAKSLSNKKKQGIIMAIGLVGGIYLYNKAS